VIGIWTLHSGGYYATDWYPATIVVAVVLVVALLVVPRPQLGRAGVVTLVAFGAYVAWSYLSVLWAQVPADALDGSNRAALYLLAFTLFAILPWRLASATAALGLFILTVATIGFVTLVRLGVDSSPAHLLSVTRLTSPIDYQNANGALWVMGAVPAVLGSADARIPKLLRALLLGGGGLLIDLALLTQSRGALIALPIVLVIGLVCIPYRRQAAIAVTAVLVSTVAPLPWLLAVFRAQRGAQVDAAVHHAALASLAHAIALFAVGAILAAPRRRPAASGWARRRRRLLAVSTIAGGGGVLAEVIGHLPRLTATHFADDDPGRLDLWRVAVKVIQSHPVVGLGQDNFEGVYLQYRHTALVVSWTHSLELRLLVHTGAIGAGLFTLFAASAVRAALARNPDAPRRSLMVMATTPALLWMLHGSIDWLWEFPVLSVPAMAGLGLAVALGRRPGDEGPPSRPKRYRWRVLTVLPVAVVAIAMVPLYLAARDVDGAQNWRKDPGGALHRLSLAGQENPLSERPDIVAGLISVARDDLATASGRFAAAVDRAPSDWFANFAIGLVDTAQGDLRGARTSLDRARSLNPTEPLIPQALARLTTANPLTFKSGQEELQPEMLALTTIGSPLDYAAVVGREVTASAR
jgi:O-Antigen ligase